MHLGFVHTCTMRCSQDCCPTGRLTCGTRSGTSDDAVSSLSSAGRPDGAGAAPGGDGRSRARRRRPAWVCAGNAVAPQSGGRLGDAGARRPDPRTGPTSASTACTVGRPRGAGRARRRCRTHAVRRPGALREGHRRQPQPRVLLVAPLSGHFATLLRGTVQTLLPDNDVYITDWHNARDVAAERTAASASTNTSSTSSTSSRRSGPGAHLVAVCQPCADALAAVALMAEDDNPGAAAQHDPDGRARRHAHQPDQGQRAGAPASRSSGSSRT